MAITVLRSGGWVPRAARVVLTHLHLDHSVGLSFLALIDPPHARTGEDLPSLSVLAAAADRHG